MSTRILLTSATQATSNYWILEQDTTTNEYIDSAVISSTGDIFIVVSNVKFIKISISGIVQFVKFADLVLALTISASDIIHFCSVASNAEGTSQFLTTNTSGSVLNRLNYNSDRQHFDIKIDSGNSAIVSGYYNGTNPCLYKYSNIGVTTYIRYFTYGTSNSPAIGKTAVDSSNNAYCIINDFNNNTFITSCHLVKFNSTGTYQWQRRMNIGTQMMYQSTCLTDSTGNVYVVANGDNTTTGFVDSHIFKINTSGTLVWQKRFPNLSSNYLTATIDAADNLYLASPNASGLYIIKYNSSGTLQWQRRVSLTTPFSNTFSYSAIYTKGTALIVTYSTLVQDTPAYVLSGVIRYPLDGSITGTFTNYIIEETFETDTTPTYTLSTTATFTSTNATDAATSSSTTDFVTDSITTNLYSIG